MAYKIVNDDSLTSVANAIRVQGSISGTIEFPDGFVSAIQNLSPSSNDFVITLSWDTQDEMWTIDKTYAEAYAAYQAGKTLTTTVDATDFSDGIVVGSRVWFENDANLFWLYIIWGSDTEKFGGGKHQLYGLSSLDGYYLAETHDALLYPQFESPSRTYTPTTSTQTETITYDASDDFNGIDHVGVTVNPIPSNYKDTTDATATADKILQGYTAYANGQKLVGTASGGITPSGTYSITSNGIYDIVSFASVDVNVSGGGGDHDAEDGIIQKTISGVYENSRVTSIGEYAFYPCSSLTTANFTNAITIGPSAFNACTGLTTISFPNAVSVGSYAFAYCTNLLSADFPKTTAIGSYAFERNYSISTISFPNALSIYNNAFQRCSNLTAMHFPKVTSIFAAVFQSCSSISTASFPKLQFVGSSAFAGCRSLMSLYILASRVPTLSSLNALYYTPMSSSSFTGSFGSIYVPASLVDSYKTAKNWSAYSSRITAYEG